MIQLNEEQRIIQDSVARYLSDNCPFELRQPQIDSPEGFDITQWKAFADLGWLGLPFPDKYGGYGGSLLEAAIIVEQLGRSLYRSPYLSSVVGAGLVLLSAGTEQHKITLLPAIAEGRILVSCAFEEKEIRSSLQAGPPTRAVAVDNGYTLTGDKSLAPYAQQADYFIVSALLHQEPRLFLVPGDAHGIDVTGFKMYDGSRAGDVRLSRVAVAGDALMQGNGTETVDVMVDRESAVLCAEASGIMWAVHDQTLEYLKTREQFGQKLSAFQALQHRMVDVYVKCQLAQSLAWDAIDAVAHEADPRVRGQRVSAAKSFIGEAGRNVGKEGVHLHGGIGMTDALPIGHYLKRLTAIDRLHGDSATHRNRFRYLDALVSA